jgi:hypothetical protein
VEGPHLGVGYAFYSLGGRVGGVRYVVSGGVENACGLFLMFIKLGKREATKRGGALLLSRHPRLTTRARLIVFQTLTYIEYVFYIVTMHMHGGIRADCSPRRKQ